MHCITVNQEGSPEPSSTTIQDLETATTVLPSNGINDLLSRTIRDRPENENRIRGIPEDVETCPADPAPPNEPPFFFSSSEYERLIHAPGVTDAHRVWIDKFFEVGIFVMEGEGDNSPACSSEPISEIS